MTVAKKVIVLNEYGATAEEEALRRCANELMVRKVLVRRAVFLAVLGVVMIVATWWLASPSISDPILVVTVVGSVLLLDAIILLLLNRAAIASGERAAANICATMAFLRLDWEIRHTSNGPLLFRMTYLNGRMRIDYHDDPE